MAVLNAHCGTTDADGQSLLHSVLGQEKWQWGCSWVGREQNQAGYVAYGEVGKNTLITSPGVSGSPTPHPILSNG